MVKMEKPIDDNVKKQLLDLLSEEPPMVLSTAYIYAKNYVQYGEDITKAWTTAVQQSSIIQEVRQKAWVEAYDSFKKEYENRLKADMMAILEELKEEFKKLYPNPELSTYYRAVDDCSNLTQQKIDALRVESEE